MRIQSWILKVLTLMALGSFSAVAHAQYPPQLPPGAYGGPPAQFASHGGFAPGAMPGGMPMMGPAPGMRPGIPTGSPMGPGMGGPGMMGGRPAPTGLLGHAPKALTGPGQPPMMVPPGGVMPASHNGAYYPPADGEGMISCPACGGGGCQNCGGHGRIADNFSFENILGMILPYGAGGVAAPRWYDVIIEGVHWRREDVSRLVNFTSDGINGPIALSTDNLGFNEEGGLRFMGQIQLGAGNSIEVDYVGLINWSSSAQVQGAGNLYSTFSDFGLDPFGGFAETDMSDLQRIEYSSNIESIAMNFKRYWTAPNPRFQGAWMAGVRHVRLEETFVYLTNGAGGFFNYQVDTDNAMTGFQVGLDSWVTLIPGFRVGVDVKGGVYVNGADSITVYSASSIPDPVGEAIGEDDVAFLGELNIISEWRINQSWTIRTGYQMMYLDGVALAAENFNSGPPFVANERTPFINHNGDIFLHGFSAGAAYAW